MGVEFVHSKKDYAFRATTKPFSVNNLRSGLNLLDSRPENIFQRKISDLMLKNSELLKNVPQIAQLEKKFDSEQEAITYFEDTLLDNLLENERHVDHLKNIARTKQWNDLLERITYYESEDRDLEKRRVLDAIDNLDLDDPRNLPKMIQILEKAQYNGWDEIEDIVIKPVRDLEDSVQGLINLEGFSPEALVPGQQNENEGNMDLPEVLLPANDNLLNDAPQHDQDIVQQDEVVIDMPPIPQQQAPNTWSAFFRRIFKKGFGGTTMGDIANSIGIGSTIASMDTVGEVASGGLAIGGGTLVGLGGLSQVVTSNNKTDTIKGLTNITSGISGIISGGISYGGSESVVAVLGKISAGAWGLAEAINFVQKANAIYSSGNYKGRDTIHALNSLLKASAGALLAISGANSILILASVLGGLGATSSVITGLHKLYEIYKSGNVPVGNDNVVNDNVMENV